MSSFTQKENLKSKPNKIRPEKVIIFWCTVIRQLESNCLDFFLQKVHLITKYLLPEKISHLTSLQAEIQGGGAKRTPQPLSFGERPSLLRVKLGEPSKKLNT